MVRFCQHLQAHTAGAVASDQGSYCSHSAAENWHVLSKSGVTCLTLMQPTVYRPMQYIIMQPGSTLLAASQLSVAAPNSSHNTTTPATYLHLLPFLGLMFALHACRQTKASCTRWSEPSSTSTSRPCCCRMMRLPASNSCAKGGAYWQPRPKPLTSPFAWPPLIRHAPACWRWSGMVCAGLSCL